MSLRQENRARRLAESALTSLVTIANQAAEAIAASVGPCRLALRDFSSPNYEWQTISRTGNAAEAANAVRDLSEQVSQSGCRVFSDARWSPPMSAPGLAVIVLARGVAVRASRTGDTVSLEVHGRRDQEAESSAAAVA